MPRWQALLVVELLQAISQNAQSQPTDTVLTLTGNAPSQPYAELALKLGLTEAAVKMTIHRLRQRYGELLRLEVAQTVLTPGEIDQELRHLLSALSLRS